MKVLEAREGYYLTNGEAFGKTITLGVNDSKENWHEVAENDINEQTDGGLEEVQG